MTSHGQTSHHKSISSPSSGFQRPIPRKTHHQPTEARSALKNDSREPFTIPAPELITGFILTFLSKYWRPTPTMVYLKSNHMKRLPTIHMRANTKLRSPGRPPRAASTSTKLVTIRTTETERDRLNSHAAKLGMSTAEYIRSLIPPKVFG